MGKKVSEVVEDAAYLSTHDRYFNPFPSDLEDEYKKYLEDVVYRVSSMNPAYDALKVGVGDLSLDTDLDVNYIDLPFYEIYRGEFLLTGSQEVINLKNLGINDFFSKASFRQNYSWPTMFTFNSTTKRCFVAPKISTTGHFNFFGNKKVAYLGTAPDETFPDDISPVCINYITYSLAETLAAAYSVDFDAAKQQLKNMYRKSLLAEFDTNTSRKTMNENEGYVRVLEI